MSSFRRLVREAHRRSIWQVFSLYAVSAWVVLQVADTLTQSLGLPDWVPGFALVLLLIGLPVVLATAVVQEGGPGQDARRAGEDPGQDDAHMLGGEPHPILGTSDEISRVGSPEGAPGNESPAAGPGFVERYFTWRNALLGGVAAFALLGMAVAGYFAMWASGIGPVGSLVAQGVLDERERVVLADFRNATTDPSVADVVTEALRVDLVQSPVLTVADRSFVDRVLRRMERDPGTHLEPELAREVAVREGLKAVIRGDVAPAGDGYLLTAAIVLAEDGRTLAAFRETAASDDDLIAAIDALSRGIREKAGESLPSIRAGEPLVTVTTSSLDALRLYTEGLRLEDAGRVEEALTVLEDAVAEDSAFAMAWRKVAVVRNNLREPPDRIRAAASAAYRHRERLSERERYLATAYYHDAVTEDQTAAEQAYRRVLRIDPEEGVALNNLALVLLGTDRHDEAARLLERAVAGPGESIQAHRNLIRARLLLGDPEGAERALEGLREGWPEVPFLETESRIGMSMVRGDLEAARRHATAVAQDPGVPFGSRTNAATTTALSLLAEGRVGEAEARIEEAVRRADAEGRPDVAVTERLQWSELLRDVTGSRDRARAALRPDVTARAFEELPPSERPWPEYAVALAAAGRPDEARRAYDAWERETPIEIRGPGYRSRRASTLARILVEEGEEEGALEAFDSFIRISGCRLCFRVNRADLLVRLDRVDEAVPLLESAVSQAHPLLNLTPLERTLAHERLGRIHEEAGNPQRAARAHATFARAWSGADPFLQPRVEHARARAGALSVADGP